MHAFRHGIGGPSGTEPKLRILRSTQRSSDHIVAEVAICVQSGGTIIFPTETVYGIGCDPENSAAIDAIFEAKARRAEKPLALHVTGLAQAQPFVSEWSDLALRAVERFWPGPVAIIVPRKLDRGIRAARDLPTISLRCPSHDLCRAILARTGPLAATSANRSDEKAFLGFDGTESMLPDASLAVLAGPTPLRAESTIVDCTGVTPVVLREGAVPASAIVAALGTLRPV